MIPFKVCVLLDSQAFVEVQKNIKLFQHTFARFAIYGSADDVLTST